MKKFNENIDWDDFDFEEEELPDIRCSFYEFTKQYIIIKDKEGNEQKFSDRQLNDIKEMEKMMNKGYELKFVYLRKGTQLCWLHQNFLI